MLAAPNELPHGKQLTELTDLIGHTVKLVFEGTDLKADPFYPNVVIVTETGCFIAFKADDDEIAVTNPYIPQSLKTFVGTKAMAREGLLGPKAVETQKRADELERIRYLKKSAKEARHTASENTRRAERDEAEAAKLETEIAQSAKE